MKEEEIIEKVEKIVKDELEGKVSPDMFGYINIFEKRKKEILEKEYGIKFETTKEKSFGKRID